MKRHISIDIKSAIANDITVMEWCLLECIHFSSNNETGYCYASKEQLRNHIGVSNGQIYKMIDNLEKRGLIKKHKDTGHLKTTEKWMQVERGDSLQKMENDSPKNGDELLQKMETLTIKGEIEGRDEVKKTSKKESSVSIEVVEAEVIKEPTGEKAFEEFWEYYPLKKAKGRARVAFRLAIKKTDIQTMLCALDNNKRSKKWMENNGKFIPHPATWLNDECWDDEMTMADVSTADYVGAVLGGKR